MVMNITDLKEHMDSVIMKKLDHKNLDKDVSYFQNVVSRKWSVEIPIFDPQDDFIFFSQAPQRT